MAGPRGSEDPVGLAARLRARARAKRRRLKFTREGWYYLFFTVGVGTAALNTGNNLLFLVLGLQLTTIIVSGVLSEAVLRQLEISRLPRPDPVAGESFVAGFQVRNRKRFWPSFSLVLADRQGPLAGGRASLLRVGPGEGGRALALLSAPGRGRFQLGTVTVSTRFPFGFFEKSKEVEVPGEIYVLPSRIAPGEPRIRGGERDGERPENRAGLGTEFLGFREIRPGDDRRLVHWRKSAAVGRLLVVEHERERRRRVVLVVDNRGPSGGDWLERPVREAAAQARLLSGRGLEVGLAASGVWLAPATGAASLRRLLRALATLGPAAPAGPAPDPRREPTVRVVGGAEAA